MVKVLRIVEKRTTRHVKRLDLKVGDAAATVLQKCFRGHRARKECSYLVSLVRYASVRRTVLATWYTSVRRTAFDTRAASCGLTYLNVLHAGLFDVHAPAILL